MDITHADIDKNRLYASLGVPEFWRFDVDIWNIYCLVGDVYEESDTSLVFSFVQKKALYRFLEEAKQDEVESEVHFRNWMRNRLNILS